MVLISFKGCLERQINKAVRITCSTAEFALSSNNYFHQAPITRVVNKAGLQTLQGEDKGWVAVRSNGGTSRAARGNARGNMVARAGTEGL